MITLLKNLKYYKPKKIKKTSKSVSLRIERFINIINDFFVLEKIGTIKHLKENNTTYKDHWCRAMSMSMALFIHAWIPSLFSTYASDKMNQNHN